LGAMTGIVANMASIEAIKLLIGAHDRLNRGLTWVDCWYNLFERTPATTPVADCPTCQLRQFTFLDAPAWKRAVTLCGRDAVQVRPPTPVVLDLSGLAARLRPLGDVRWSPQALRLVMPPHEMTVFRDGRAIIKGTSELAVARSLYARLIGT
ncbi:MAG: thiazole biosynthesis adenylyltransferase ThiF, partial [Chloroflexota bacterium]